MFMCIWPFTWCNKHKLLKFIVISLGISHFLLASQREREAMKGERTHYDALNKS